MSSNVPFTEFLDAYGAFTSAIRSHIAYADSRPEVRAALTDTTRIAFLEIISRANIKNPHQPIWLRVDRTAERLGISTKSVSRTIKMMRKNGWLVPSKTHDGRNNHGEFDGREYLLTPAMRRLMALAVTSCAEDGGSGDNSAGTPRPLAAAPHPTAPCPPPAQAHQLSDQQSSHFGTTPASLPAGSSLSKALDIIQRRAAEECSKKASTDVALAETAAAPAETPAANAVLPCEVETSECVDRTDLSSGVIYEVNKVFSLKEASLHKGAFFEKPEERKTPRLPADLLALRDELEISPGGICSLMKLAKEKGHRLQDVWKVKRDQILNAGAKHGRAVAYLRFLLNCGEDFSYIARTKFPNQPPPGDGGAPPAGSDEQTQPSPPASAKTTSVPLVADATDGVLAKLLEIAKATRFKRFRHISNGMLVRFYDGTAEVTRGLERVVVAGWENLQGYYIGISKGNLVPVTE